MKKNNTIKRFPFFFLLAFLAFNQIVLATSEEEVVLEEKTTGSYKLLPVEEKLKTESCCTAEEARELLRAVIACTEQPTLTQEEVAEALYLARSTVSDFLKGVNSPKLLTNLEWYYRSQTIPLSSLKWVWENVDLPTETRLEDDFMRAATYSLLPKKLKNKENIKNYLTELLGGDRRRLDLLCNAITVDVETMNTFLSNWRSLDNFRPVYQALRRHYRAKGARPLSEIIEEKMPEEKGTSWSLSSLFGRLNLSSSSKGPYERVKAQ
jgi:transcriptional regulator with XRE-family HTH domain